MKRRIFRRIIAAAVVLAVVGANLPAGISITGLSDSITLTANAEDTAADASTVFGELKDGLYTLTSSTYTLSTDLKSSGRIYIPENVEAVVDLNGHTIDRGLHIYTEGGSVFGVAAGGKLTVKNGTVKGGARLEGNGGGFNL